MKLNCASESSILSVRYVRNCVIAADRCATFNFRLNVLRFRYITAKLHRKRKEFLLKFLSKNLASNRAER